MTLPHYILRRFVEPGGERLPRPKPFVKIAGTCPVCKKAVVYIKINNFEQIDGSWLNGDTYHWKCRQEAGPYVNRKGKVLKGNLEEEEYRFWVGVPEMGMGFAMCRACRTTFYNKLDRDAHFRDTAHRVGGEQCSVRLVNAYKKLSDLLTCLVCKRSRFGHSKWGVPICDDPECVAKWKFQQGRYMPLEAELYRAKKVLISQGTPKIVQAAQKIAYVDTPAGTRAWCTLCSMYCDNEGHDYEHAQKLIGGVDSRVLE